MKKPVVPAPASAPPAAKAPARTKSAMPAFDSRELLESYIRKDYDAVCLKSLDVLQFFYNTTLVQTSAKEKLVIDSFVSTFLFIMGQSDFRVPDRHAVSLIRMNLTISNLVAISSTRTTDGVLENLLNQEGNLVKFLALCSARDQVEFSRSALFAANDQLASLWYNAYGEIFRTGVVSPLVCKNLQTHYAFDHPKYNSIHEAQELFFGSTYVDGETDRLVKPRVNACVRRSIKKLAGPIKNRPDPRKIAVISSVWYPGHSVYRNYYHYLKALEGFHLTFFRLHNPRPEMDLSLFDEVRSLDREKGELNLEPIRDNDFMLVYFPDVGMHYDSIALANLRLAPIMAASPGHSVSTWGSEIDYFISGVDAELPKHAERNYSERLVLLPGCGVIHNQPNYKPTGRAKSISEFIINCPWTAMKMNTRFVETIQDLISRSYRKLRLRLFVAGSLQRQNDFLPFANMIFHALGKENVELVTARGYADFMKLMEEGDLSIDSYHFGGCNSVADSLFLRKPIVTWEYDKWYGRIGSAMLRMVGLEELIATSEQDYLEKVLRLIHDDPYRDAVTAKLQKVDLDETIFSTKDAPSFQRAVRYLIENHDQLKREKSREPIRIT